MEKNWCVIHKAHQEKKEDNKIQFSPYKKELPRISKVKIVVDDDDDDIEWHTGNLDPFICTAAQETNRSKQTGVTIFFFSTYL